MVKILVTASRKLITFTPTLMLLVTAAMLYAITQVTVAEATGATAGTPRPTPANQATANYLNALATAEAALNATPTPEGTLTPPATATAGTTAPPPTALALVIVTETPTPLNIITVAAIAARATAVAATLGTYTPMPFNWVAPIVVTSEPPTDVPGNAATAAFQVAEATASAFVFGTATATPVNVWTATPTPIMRPVIGEVATPWLSPTPTATPLPMPQELVGKILFLSNRSGGPWPLAEPLVYAINPDGSGLAVLNDDTFYQLALARDIFSADLRYRAFAQDVPRKYGSRSPLEYAPAIFFYDYEINSATQVSSFGTGEAWEPVWSPVRDQIAFVSNVNEHAEIWVINRDGSGGQPLTQTDEAAFASEVGKNNYIADDENGHPSWSPDGSRLVFWSSRTGRRQLWVMNADGSNAYSLSTTHHDDWNPVWVKYTDAPRPVPVLAPPVVN